MGAWGPGIFSDDLALEVRDEWRSLILGGTDAAQASRALVDRYAGDPAAAVYETVFWTALAAAQMETGRLQPDVRDRALALIDAGGDVDVWEESGNGRRRERVLQRLATRLGGPQPAPKRLRRSRAAGGADEEWDRRLRAMREHSERVWPTIRDSALYREFTDRMREAGIDPADGA